MILFPILWLAGAVVAMVCILIGLDEVLLVQAVVTVLYLLTLIRGRSRRRVQAEAVKITVMPDLPDHISDLTVPVDVPTVSDRFGAGSPDELHPRLLRKAIQIEQRKLQLQVSTL